MEAIAALMPLLAIFFGLVIAAINMKLIAKYVLKRASEAELRRVFPGWYVSMFVWFAKLGERHEPS